MSKNVHAFLLVALGVIFAAGCASSTNVTSEEHLAERTIEHAPPEGEDPIDIPRGAPVLEDYARPAPSGERAALSDDLGGAQQIPRAELERLLDKGPGWGLSHVEVAPVKGDDGGLVGFRVEAMSEEAAAWLLPALQLGDQITHLNGVRIRTPDDYMEAWNLARGATELRIDYVREDAPGFSSWIVAE